MKEVREKKRGRNEGKEGGKERQKEGKLCTHSF